MSTTDLDIETQCVVLRNYLDTAEQEVKQLKCGRKASSARSRKALMELKKGSHELRKSVMQFQRELPVKSKTKKVEEPVEAIEDLPPPPELKREESEASVKHKPKVKPKTEKAKSKPKVSKQTNKTK